MKSTPYYSAGAIDHCYIYQQKTISIAPQDQLANYSDAHNKVFEKWKLSLIGARRMKFDDSFKIKTKSRSHLIVGRGAS